MSNGRPAKMDGRLHRGEADVRQLRHELPKLVGDVRPACCEHKR
jgi:hypothetical protein